jgi:hypothetical protein
MKKPRKARISEKTFGLFLEVYANSPQKDTLARAARLVGADPDAPESVPDEAAHAWAMCCGNIGVIWLSEWPADEGSLAHELYHIVAGFLAHIDTKDEETGAYLTGFFDRHIRKLLK